MGDTPHAPDVRRRARGPAAGVAGRVERRHRAAPRAVGRNGVSAWPGRQRDLAGGPDRRGRGRVRRDHLRPLVQAPILGRRGEEGALAVRRYAVRPGRRPRIPRDFGAPEPSRGPARMARPRRDARATAGDAGGRPVRRGRGGGSGCGRRRGRGVGRPSGDDREAGARNTGRGGATRRASARRRRPASPAGRARRTAQREARGHAGEAASSRGARAEGDAAAAEAPRRYGASRSAEAARRLPGLAEAAVCARATDARRASSRVRTRHPAAPRPPGRASAAAACRTCSRGRRDSDDRERNGRGGVRRADRDDARHSSGGDSSSSASARVFSASDSADITSGSDSTGVPDPRTPASATRLGGGLGRPRRGRALPPGGRTVAALSREPAWLRSEGLAQPGAPALVDPFDHPITGASMRSPAHPARLRSPWRVVAAAHRWGSVGSLSASGGRGDNGERSPFLEGPWKGGATAKTIERLGKGRTKPETAAVRPRLRNHPCAPERRLASGQHEAPTPEGGDAVRPPLF